MSSKTVKIAYKPVGMLLGVGAGLISGDHSSRSSSHRTLVVAATR
jgi:hypothetical protein